ncbi:IS3 family transposase [Glaciimonas sp. GG7]
MISKAFARATDLLRGKEGMSITKACQLLGISRQTYYKRIGAQVALAARNSTVQSMVTQVRLKQPRIGTRKLHYLLKDRIAEAGIKLGRDGLFRSLRMSHMLVKPKRSYHKTTDSRHWMFKHPNLIKDAPKPGMAEQLWVADITYIDTRETTAYLSLVTDAHSRKIMGHHLHPTLHTDGVAKALKMALKKRATDQQLIHHSDRGLQYCSAAYQRLHQSHDVLCSMTDGYDCYQNALAERINGIIKNEFLTVKPDNFAQAAIMIDQSIQTYNHERPHLALQYKTPDAVHQASVFNAVKSRKISTKKKG